MWEVELNFCNMAKKGVKSLHHICGSLKAAHAMGLNENLLMACSQKDVKMDAPRPADVSLNISKAVALGYKPLSVDEELKLVSGNTMER